MQNKMIRFAGILLAMLFLVPTLMALQVQTASQNVSQVLALQNQMPEEGSNAYDLLQQVVRLDFKNVSLEDALIALADQANLRLMYRKALLPVDKNLSYENSIMTVYDALWEVLDGTGIQFAISQNRQLVLLRMREVEKVIDPEVQMTVRGRVTDDQTGEAIPGVNVFVEGSTEAAGTTIGTTTNTDGYYEIQVPEILNTLVFSYIGYRTEEIEVEGRVEIDIVLQPQTVVGEDLVVVGYGTLQAEEITGAISSINSEDFVQGTVTDAAQLIQGKVAGLNIVTPDANPTSTSQINLRGVTTLLSSSSPLVLINGVPGHLREISPEEIESIDVLKGGSAAAIYGTRGSNGVILITTKNITGATPPAIRINSYVNTQRITRKLDFMNASEYRQRVSEGITGTIDQGSDTDWLDAVTQTPVTQVHDVSLQSGTQNTSYTLSLRYSDQNGIMRNSTNKIIYPRMEVNHTTLDGLIDIKANISGYEQEYYSGARTGEYNHAIYYNALIYNPTAPVRDSNGNWFQNLNRHAYDNPVGLQEEARGKNQNDKLKYYGTVTFHPKEKISIRLLGSQDRSRNVSGYYETQDHTSTLRNSLNGYASRSTSRNQEDLFEITAEYDETFIGEHNITALVGYAWNQINSQSYSMDNWDFPTDLYDYNNMGAGLALSEGIAQQSSYQSESRLISYFFRLNYNYKSRYLLSGTIRHEGSTKFGENHRWANFPAISAGWNVHNESFLENIIFISTLRFRGGFGITGTAPSDPYLSLNHLNFDQRALIGAQWIQVNMPSSNPNPDLRWETKEEFDIGFDFGFLNDRISGSIDLYQRTTKDMLWNYGVPSPPFLYNTITANAATMENKGIEIRLDANLVQTTNVMWNSGLNFSSNQNEITSLSNDRFQIESGFFDVGSTGEPILQPTHRVEIGEPIGNFYGYKTIGIDENGRWIIEGSNGEPKPISEQQADDKQILGNGLPDHYLNWNNTLAYKNFDLNVQMRGAFGFQILNTQRMFYEPPINLARGNVLNSAFDEVYGERPLSLDQELQYVSHYIEDGDYWKIGNITLGYNLNFENSTFVDSLRLYASVSNLKTFTGYRGIDPEVSIDSLTPGIDLRHRYPAAQTFTIGVNLIF